ncbi:helix-turn-helix domain-containing protein [Companilactobacillus baiquanensis]|uniref:AraC family transcriptional regulator n=1 Tax=Companilactobacillus baiquanensis TaxID=2486005 RepID=A0ABW1UVX2_9LACO|nr:helix-turn-helix domain-containing protein [Companilactobacillus baiquanensis]
MDNSNICFSKVVLNKLIKNIEFQKTNFDIPYWGALEHHFGTQNHRHYFFEVCLITSGEGFYYEHDKKYSVHRNSLIFTQARTVHQMHSEAGMSLVYLSFVPKTVNGWDLYSANYQLPVLNLSENDPIVLTWDALLNLTLAYDENNKMSVLSMQSLSDTVFQLIIDRETNGLNESDRLIAVTDQTELLRSIKRYIRANISTPLSINKIANHFFISRRQIFRLFKKYEPYSCNSFIQQTRIEYAANLLSNSTMSITDISSAVGFSSIHYFSSVFTKKMRDTPQKFRLLYSNAQIKDFGSNE